jgi:hypothetical protein
MNGLYDESLTIKIVCIENIINPKNKENKNKNIPITCADNTELHKYPI